MKYRGLGSRARIVGWLAFALVVEVVLYLSAPSAVNTALDWLTTQQESLAWYASRILGFLAYGALAVSVIYGLLLSTGILDAVAHRTVSFSLHQDLSAIAIALTALHGSLLALDTFVPQSVVELVVPFAGPYRPAWVGIGQLSFYLVAVVYLSFYARRRIGQRRWRLLHYATFLAFVGATAHGLMSGTDTPAAWAYWTYAVCSAVVAFLFVYRVTLALASRVERSRPAPQA